MRGRACLALTALLLAAPAGADVPVIPGGPITAQTLAAMCAATENSHSDGTDRYFCEGYIRAAIDLDPRLRRLRADCRNETSRIADAMARRHRRNPDGIGPGPASDLIVALARTLCPQTVR